MKRTNTLIKQVVIGLLLLQGVSSYAENLLPYPIDTINGKTFYLYEVEKSIGLYRVSINFGVSQEEIIRCNPILRERGLRYGDTILIPVTAKTVSSIPDKGSDIENQTIQADTLRYNDPAVASIVAEACLAAKNTSVAGDSATIIQPADNDSIVATDRKATHIVLLLPLQARNTKRDQKMDQFVDFYEGVLLALYQLQSSGEQFVLDVYDTEKSDIRVRQLLQDSVLTDADCIIGPAYPLQLMCVGEWAKQHHIPVLTPFIDHVEGIESNPFLLQFNPSYRQEAEAMAEWMETHRTEINCVLIDAKDADIPPVIRQLRKEIMARDIPYTTTTIRDILNDSISLSLKDSVENILIFNTEKYGSIQVLLPRVVNAKGGHRVTLYTKYTWRKESIPLPEVYTSIFATDVLTDTSEYETLYNRYFGHAHASDTPRFDLLGYDVTQQLIAFLKGTTYQGLQSDIHFEQITPEGGYINTHISIQHTSE